MPSMSENGPGGRRQASNDDLSIESRYESYSHDQRGRSARRIQQDSRHLGSSGSTLLDPSDAVSVHYLTETALGDSQYYQVLTLEEVDQVKKELTVIMSRIPATRRKLTLERKLREAAKSLNKLYTPLNREGAPPGLTNTPKKHRRNFLASRDDSRERSRGSDGSDLVSQTDEEVAASIRKCEELALELWELERRGAELQRKLLEHTAGILQMTHKGYVEDIVPPTDRDTSPKDGNNGTGRSNLSNNFDHRSWYRSYDGDQTDHDGLFSPDEVTEQRLAKLVSRLNQIIIVSDDESETASLYAEGGRQNHQTRVYQSLDALDSGLEILSKTYQEAQHRVGSVKNTELTLKELNSQLHASIARSSLEMGSGFPAPPQVHGQSLQDQFNYMAAGLDALKHQKEHLIDVVRTSTSKGNDLQGKALQFENTLTDLWAIIIESGDISKQQDRQQESMETEEPRDSSNGAFSLQGFSAKVQALHSRAMALQEQKDILTRQVQQQREINSETDAQKDANMKVVTSQLEETRNRLATASEESKLSKDQLIALTQRFDAMTQESASYAQKQDLEHAEVLDQEKLAKEAVENRMLAELHSKQEQVSELENELSQLRHITEVRTGEVQARLDESTNRAKSLVRQLEMVTESKLAFEVQNRQLGQLAEERTAELEKLRQDMRNLEGEVVRLQTEVTVARADLDAAYGTRAQRAAEVAASPAIQKEFDEVSMRNQFLLEEIAVLKTQGAPVASVNTQLQERIEVLQRELTETIEEYEVMTKSSIEYEKEREQLENTIDNLRDRCETLDCQLSDQRVSWLGMKSTVAQGGAKDSVNPGTTSIMVLKNEFKKMMRETRTENMKALRAEQDERRKLEALVRTMKRDQIPGKSSLSKSMTVDQ